MVVEGLGFPGIVLLLLLKGHQDALHAAVDTLMLLFHRVSADLPVPNNPVVRYREAACILVPDQSGKL